MGVVSQFADPCAHRAFLRSAIERDADLEVVAIHDVAPADVPAHLLERDAVYGRFAHPVRTENGALVVAGRRIGVVEDEDRGPSWGDLGPDVRHRGQRPAAHVRSCRPPPRRRGPQGHRVRPAPAAKVHHETSGNRTSPTTTMHVYTDRMQAPLNCAARIFGGREPLRSTSSRPAPAPQRRWGW